MFVHSALAVLLVCFSSLALAQTSEAYLTDVAPTVQSKWKVEGVVQAHSVAGNGSPWIGVAGAYKLVDWGYLGLRGFVPLAHTVDESTYAIQFFGRARLTSTRYTEFFTEVDFAQNFFNFLPFTSYGVAVGSLSRITPGFSVGFFGGLEMATVVIDSIGLERRNSFFIYPKVALLADFAF
jgi:hypothetical protein